MSQCILLNAVLVYERSALADPYCQSAWNSACLFVEEFNTSTPSIVFLRSRDMHIVYLGETSKTLLRSSTSLWRHIDAGLPYSCRPHLPLLGYRSSPTLSLHMWQLGGSKVFDRPQISRPSLHMWGRSLCHYVGTLEGRKPPEFPWRQMWQFGDTPRKLKNFCRARN